VTAPNQVPTAPSVEPRSLSVAASATMPAPAQLASACCRHHLRPGWRGFCGNRGVLLHAG
jgi:hypothetical protein